MPAEDNFISLMKAALELLADTIRRGFSLQSGPYASSVSLDLNQLFPSRTNAPSD
jgi:hypothetical protein